MSFGGVGSRRHKQPGDTWSSSPVTPRGTLVSQKTQIPWHKTSACTTWGGGITGTAACTATGASMSYCNSVFANGGNKPAAAAAAGGNPATSVISALQAASINRVWDPILAAQLTQGAMCCAAQYYGTADGMPVSGFVPPLSGGDMAAEVSPGGMCPAHS